MHFQTLFSPLLKVLRMVLLSSLLWWELGTSPGFGPGEWLSFWRVTRKQFWFWFRFWAASWQNQQNGMCAQRRLRSAWAYAQSDQSSLCAQWVAKNPSFIHQNQNQNCYWWHVQMTIIHQDLWWGKLVPSPYKRSELSNRVFCSFSNRKESICKWISISNSRGGRGEEAALVNISISKGVWNAKEWWFMRTAKTLIRLGGCVTLRVSRLMTKPTKWHVRPAKTQISLGIRPVWSESSLCAQWVAKDPSFIHADGEYADLTERMPRLIWVFAGRTHHFVGFVMRRLNYRILSHVIRKPVFGDVRPKLPNSCIPSVPVVNDHCRKRPQYEYSWTTLNQLIDSINCFVIEN